MELTHLRYFLAVAEELNFSRAAERLHISQPPLSVQIRRLEESLGVKLFHRNPRGVTLTPEGRTFQREARAIIRRADRAIGAVQSPDAATPVLRIRTLASALGGRLSVILKTFVQGQPQVMVRLLDDVFNLENRILEDQIDVGFVVQPRRTHGLVVETIDWWRLCVALPRSHRLAQHQSVPIQELSEEEFALGPQGFNHSWTSFIDKVCGQANFTPKRGFETLHLMSALSVVASGAAICFALESAKAVAPDSVVIKPLEPHTLTEIGMVYRQGQRPEWVDRFIEIVRATVAPNCGNCSSDSTVEILGDQEPTATEQRA